MFVPLPAAALALACGCQLVDNNRAHVSADGQRQFWQTRMIVIGGYVYSASYTGKLKLRVIAGHNYRHEIHRSCRLTTYECGTCGTYVGAVEALGALAQLNEIAARVLHCTNS